MMLPCDPATSGEGGHRGVNWRDLISQRFRQQAEISDPRSDISRSARYKQWFSAGAKLNLIRVAPSSPSLSGALLRSEMVFLEYFIK